MEQKIVLINEVAALMRVHPSTVRRWLGQRRKGIGSFPLPISGKGGKLRWLQSDIESFLVSQSQSNATPLFAPSVRQGRRDQKEFQQRQAAADKALQRHRKPK